MKLLIAEVQAQASRPFELGAALVSNVHSLFKDAFPFFATKIFCLARHGCRSLAKDTPRTGSANSLWQGG